jgi:hypothetical protein
MSMPGQVMRSDEELAGHSIRQFRFHEFVKSKDIPCLVGQITGTGPPSPRHHEGRSRDRHGTWRGLRWTLRRQAVLLPDEIAAAYGEVVWSWRRDRGVYPARLVAGSATVTKNAAHRGEHEANRKTIARGKPV